MVRIDLPALTDVRAAFNIQSTGDIDKTCEEVFKPLSEKGKIRGEYYCDGDLNEDAVGNADTIGDDKSSKNDDKKGAASAFGVSSGALLAGLVAAFFL